MMYRIGGKAFRLMFAAACGAIIGTPLIAGEGGPSSTFLSPRAVIYPGDVIDGGVLSETRDEGRYAAMDIARSRGAVDGKVARKTLLPGMPIPLSAVTTRRVVRNGAEVRLIYSDGDLMIATFGEAMQDGGVGELIKCRNPSSGVMVSGIVMADGTVRVRG